MNNSASFIMFKSSRKNAVSSDFFYARHLISKDEQLTDARILEQFIGTIEKVMHESKKFNGHLEIACNVYLEKSLEYQAIKGIYQDKKNIGYRFERKRYYSIEQITEFVYTMYMLVYPYSKLHSYAIFDNPSIKYLIGQYYHD